jgi:hypothetical protein
MEWSSAEKVSVKCLIAILFDQNWRDKAYAWVITCVRLLERDAGSVWTTCQLAQAVLFAFATSQSSLEWWRRRLYDFRNWQRTSTDSLTRITQPQQAHHLCLLLERHGT